jgi:hypothetical protein
MKNIANAYTPKSAIAMLPPRPLRGSGKLAQTHVRPERRDGKSCSPTLNQTFADSNPEKAFCGIVEIAPVHTNIE